MATYRSSSSAASLSNPSFSCPKPTGLVAGDMLISFHGSFGAFGSSEDGVSGGEPWITVPVLYAYARIHWKIAGPSEPSSYSMTCSTAGAAGTAAMVAISDPVVTDPILSGNGTTSTPGGPPYNTSTASFNPTGDADLDFRWITGDTNPSSGIDVTSSTPSGYTELQEFRAGRRSLSVIAYKQLTSLAPTGVQTFTTTGTLTGVGFTLQVVGYSPRSWNGWGSPM